MSVFHHMIELVKRDGDWHEYVYYPDCSVGDPPLSGRLRVKLGSLVSEKQEYEIIKKAGYLTLRGNQTEEDLVATFLSQLKEHVAEGSRCPEQICFMG